MCYGCQEQRLQGSEDFLRAMKQRRRGKCCVNSIKTSLLGENYGRNNFYQGGFST